MNPPNLRYSKEHEWISQPEGGEATVGITDFAQDQLGDVVYVELPAVGTKVSKDQTFGVVESVKASSDLFAPVSGEVAEVNQELKDHPEWVNQEPFGKGWMIKVKVASPGEIDSLLTVDEYTDITK